MLIATVVQQLAGAVFRFGVRTVDGRELHSLVAGKVQFTFTKAADRDVGQVDKHTGKTTFVGQTPMAMVRSSYSFSAFALR